ncbi:MAG TPA: hypothetical protein VD839_05950 [Burkholderiales bacterium]|nr:hypothetical protein [Burkholderiales bacterium]
MIGSLIPVLLLLLPAAAALAQADGGNAASCGELVTVETHERTTTLYALAQPRPATAAGARVALVLLAGGGGHLNFDDRGCPRALKGNSLVRMLPLFHSAGFITALVDAPSDHPGEDGLAGFRIAAEHAEDLGKVIADVRRRTKASVWLVGTSRGTISAVNAAARLSGPAAPDGLVLTSALTSGYSGGRKNWMANTVFDRPLESIRVPVLVVGHAEDKCVRTPPDLMGNITARTGSAREQVVTVTGGPGEPGPQSVHACRGRSPHGYLGQEADVAAGIARFIGGGTY